MPTTDIRQLRLTQVSLRAPLGLQFLLKNISFDVFTGDRIAIVGPSGAGKTSLLRLLNRLSTPSEGSIYFEDRDIQKIPVIQLRQQVTLVLQEPKLLGMTVREAISYPLLLRSLPQQEIQARLNYWTERLHIPEDWLERTEMQLSVGQRQLVAIARALAIQPKILLLDEPTSALDAGRSAHLLRVSIQLAEENKMTILMVNHQLDLAQQFCTKVLHFQQGELIEELEADRVDWSNLRETFVRLEQQAAEEWL
ncbi:ATP-binding cassette domain-containing protein [Aerosakkonema sp. BLCC-F183]|uniref:ABC transporter ATP-binding protein n=1 Tax=Aerosakkonema sp. BLCC-F183 TaxID=3342834 RepID=UPI0035BA1B15